MLAERTIFQTRFIVRFDVIEMAGTAAAKLHFVEEYWRGMIETKDLDLYRDKLITGNIKVPVDSFCREI